MKYMLANLVAIACIGVAGYLALQSKEGWGWFLFVGLLCAGSVSSKSSKDE